MRLAASVRNEIKIIPTNEYPGLNLHYDRAVIIPGQIPSERETVNTFLHPLNIYLHLHRPTFDAHRGLADRLAHRRVGVTRAGNIF